MKYIKTYEISTFGYENIDYGDMYKASDEQVELKRYFFEKYPKKVNILNSGGYINSITLDIVLKFAIKRKDQNLINYIQKFKDKLKYIRIEKEADKYNI